MTGFLLFTFATIETVAKVARALYTFGGDGRPNQTGEKKNDWTLKGNEGTRNELHWSIFLALGIPRKTVYRVVEVC